MKLIDATYIVAEKRYKANQETKLAAVPAGGGTEKWVDRGNANRIENWRAKLKHQQTLAPLAFDPTQR
jgi:hypothetical protein